MTTALADLHEQVERLVTILQQRDSAEQAEEAADNLELLTAEADRPQPRRGILKASGQALIQVAAAVSELAEPVAKAVQAVLNATGQG